MKNKIGEREKKLRQTWRTPPDIFQKLDSIFHFDLDAAASKENALCDNYIDVRRNALNLGNNWFCRRTKSVYCNPPYKKILPWIEAVEYFVASAADDDVTAVLLLPLTSTPKWARRCMYNDLCKIVLITRRINFVSPDDTINGSPRGDHALYIFRKRFPARCKKISYWDYSSDNLEALINIGGDNA